MESLGVLDVFVRVGETRSFTAAGKQLGISASAVSKAIGRLEERLRVRLFHRSTRTVNLTPEGAQFLSVAGESSTRSKRQKMNYLNRKPPLWKVKSQCAVCGHAVHAGIRKI